MVKSIVVERDWQDDDTEKDNDRNLAIVEVKEGELRRGRLSCMMM